MKRVAIVTGASRGLGESLAGFLSAQGFALVVTARGAAELRAAVAKWSGPPSEVVALAGDITEPDHRRRLVEAAAGFGRLDLLVNNASELGPSPLRELTGLTPEELRRIFEVNIVAPVALVAAARPLLQSSHGLVVNISSDAAIGAYAGWGGYGASKAALDLVSRTLAEEMKAERIAVVAVDPGDMRTAMHQAAYRDQDISDRPLPEVTLPFWAWLLGQSPDAVSGARFRAQADTWEVPNAPR